MNLILKKSLSGALSLVLIFSALPTVFAGTFRDVADGIWYYQPVENGVARNYINKEQPYYRPQEYVKRSELAAFVVRAFNLQLVTPSQPTFRDVPTHAWYFPYIETLAHHKFAEGYKNSNGEFTYLFGPGDDVTREQATKILVNAADIAVSQTTKPYFRDVNTNMWSFSFIQSAKEAKIIQGYSDGTFRPFDRINRAEMAQILDQIFLVKGGTNATPTPNPSPTTPAPNPTPTQTDEPLARAFESLRTQSVFPVQGKSIHDVESTFGPRIKPSTGVYDWHRGMDVDATLGTPVVAAFDGELWKVENYQDGGLTVVLRHSFPQKVAFQNANMQYFYTYYMHLDSAEQPLKNAASKEQHPAVKKGQKIGTVGHSGNGYTADGTGDMADHLHFELRVGTYCSLEFQLSNPQSSCSKGFGYDPTVHPMYLFAPVAAEYGLTLSSTPNKNSDTVVRFTAPDTQPLLNRIEFSVIGASGESEKSHVLDLNRRIGYDASSIPKLDTQDKTKPYLQPQEFGDKSNQYETHIVIPKVFVSGTQGTKATLKITDIWGVTKSVEWNW